MPPKKGTPEYDKWRKSPTYDLWRKQISIAMTGERHPMYGKHHSAETLARMRAAQVGKHPSAETCAKMGRPMSGERNPMYGKHHNAEARAKMGRPMNGERHPMYGKHHSAEALAKMHVAKSGERNPNWRGGISFAPYPVSWTKHLREAIRKRDDYTCVLCGKEQNARRHDVHHINYAKEDSRPENLITLCTACHRKTNYDHEFWKNLFEMIYVPDFPKKENEK